jgi:hypothetical protein
MTYKALDNVVLDKDLPEHDLRKGDLGVLIHQYEADTFEVEFVAASGETHAMVTLTTGEFRNPTDRDLVCVRRVGSDDEG